jgi:hypothetical protein
MSPAVAARRGRPALALGVLVAVVAAGCQHDGRDLREPSSPLPATTTTSTTLPPDIVAP